MQVGAMGRLEADRGAGLRGEPARGGARVDICLGHLEWLGSSSARGGQ